jgi:hypothetical protein
MQFCLTDGTPLSALYDSEETLLLKNGDIINESQIKFPIEIFRVYCLFGYETDGARESVLWNDPMSFHHLVRERGEAFRQCYDSWKLTKRKFSRNEVLDGKWVKVADKGPQHYLELHDDGTLTERTRFSFDENDHWGGKWKLIDGILRLSINIYELDIVASRDELHSGVEDEGDHRNAYFIVAHVK